MDLEIHGVALFSEEYPPFAFGGISTVTYDLAQSLSKRRVPTTVFCGKSYNVAIEIVSDYLKIVRLPCVDFPPRFVWFQFQNLKNALKHLDRHIIIHSVNPQVSLLCTYLKKKLDRPLVTSYHGVPVFDSKSFLDSPINSWTTGDFGYNVIEFPVNEFHMRLSLANSDRIVSCSKITLNELKTVYSGIDNLKNSIVINNGVDFENLKNIRNDFREKEGLNALTIIFVGRLYYIKGITYLLKAFEFLIRDYPNTKLKIFGNGPLKETIRSMIKQKDLESKVFIMGQVERNKLLEELSKADIFVLPSLREAQSMSLLEAMAFEKPVVVFDYPFFRECIKHMYNGLLAKPRDAYDLAEKIGYLLSDSKLRKKISYNAAEYVKQNHNWDILVNDYINLYKSLS